MAYEPQPATPTPERHIYAACMRAYERTLMPIEQDDLLLSPDVEALAMISNPNYTLSFGSICRPSGDRRPFQGWGRAVFADGKLTNLTYVEPESTEHVRGLDIVFDELGVVRALWLEDARLRKPQDHVTMHLSALYAQKVANFIEHCGRRGLVQATGRCELPSIEEVNLVEHPTEGPCAPLESTVLPGDLTQEDRQHEYSNEVKRPQTLMERFREAVHRYNVRKWRRLDY